MESILSVLARDHQHCDVLFVRACADVRAGDWALAGRSVPALAEALRRHLHAEESIVFEAFDAAVGGDPPPTASLRAEHQRVLGVLQRMRDSLAGRDASAWFKHAATLRVLLQYHHEKEESVFYPAAERVLRGRRDELLAALSGFDGVALAA
jgi:hemerythrin-like domain-containing protein